MKRYILTGAPGSGKTVIIRALEVQGHVVVNEAATDLIAYEQALGTPAPGENPRFIDDILKLQKQREVHMEHVTASMQFYDRSPFCTYALALYLKYPLSNRLVEEIERLQKERVYQKRVFFIEHLGTVKPTDARRITFEESLVFEKIHEDTYSRFGFQCVKIPKAPLLERSATILHHCSSR